MTARDDAIKDLEKGTEQLLRQIGDLSDEKITEVWDGTWSIREILVHIAGWDEAIAGSFERMARGEPPGDPNLNLSDTDGANAVFVERAQGKSIAAVRKDLEVAQAHLIAAAKALPDDRFAEGKTALRLLSGMANHPAEHIGDIIEWKTGERT
jgi:uncharacterized damage-inducible protein DinB